MLVDRIVTVWEGVRVRNNKHEFVESDICEPCKKREEVCNSRQHFIDQNSFFASISQPCDGNKVVIFEDITENHNKLSIIITNNTPPPCTPIIIFETKDHNIIRRKLTTPFKAFFIEDLQRILVVCTGEPTGSCELLIQVAKTFCISCGNAESSKRIDSGNCLVDLHQNLIFFLQPCGGPREVIFENLTTNHNKVAIEVIDLDSDCSVTLFIQTKEKLIIINDQDRDDFEIQVEDLKSISIQCNGSQAGQCFGVVNMLNSFCICCSDNSCC